MTKICSTTLLVLACLSCTSAYTPWHGRPGCPAIPSTDKVCRLDCEKDEHCSGEQICCHTGCGHECKTPCEPLECDLTCRYGLAKDTNGCHICQCHDPCTECKTGTEYCRRRCDKATCKACPKSRCPDLNCPYGQHLDKRGCFNCCCRDPFKEDVTLLDEYIARPEPVYGFTLLSTDTSQPGRTVHLLNLTSLSYSDALCYGEALAELVTVGYTSGKIPITIGAKSSIRGQSGIAPMVVGIFPGLTAYSKTLTTTPVWYHYLTIIIPDTPIYTDTFTLFIDRGDKAFDAPTVNDVSIRDMIRLSEDTGSVTAVIASIPNVPLFFTSENNGTTRRSNDGIIAYSWNLVIQGLVSDRAVNAYFPMTKAAKLAADAVIEYVNDANKAYTLDSYMPTGFSKRGLVAWLLASVDKRVVALAPIVFSYLDFYQNLINSNRALGGWSFAFIDYLQAGFTSFMQHPLARIMANDIDPLVYNDRLIMPKLVFAATGDEFIFPDGTHSWWNKLNGEDNHYLLFENDSHDILFNRELLFQSMANFFVTVKEPAYEMPKYTVTQTRGILAGKISVQIDQPVNWVRVWSADTTNRTCEPEDNVLGICRRDFRLAKFEFPSLVSNGIVWTSTTLDDLGGGLYEVEMSARTDFGYRIFHIEMEFQHTQGVFRLTTEANILPDNFPFAECSTPLECLGVLK